ncbi:glycosyltransferase family protein [Adhaeribacter soli]|uniref:Glycosyltransferase family 4 protein n=1 Tax=Adhaeribacter soli TaxID=2607655 RepID=A0A5N1ISB1_9BACT|nr:glycosyltransferase family 4 protein [Adhaeribacter soli]KAA9327399.1 glycosyltransferase family 4 protein [Adhaeribacter soli]
MNKILLVAYYFRPCNYVGANRANAFADFFAEKGWDVTVVTRAWTGTEKVWEDYLDSQEGEPRIVKEASGVKIHYLPYKAFRFPENRILASLKTATRNLTGRFHFELEFDQYQDYIAELIKKEKFNYVLASSPPLTVLKVAADASENTATKLLVDIRDFENDILLYQEPRLSLLRKLQFRVLMMYFQKWIKGAACIFTASPPFTTFIAKKTDKEVFTLTNGFDDLVSTIRAEPYPDLFNISVIGTLYKEANIDTLLEGIELLFRENPSVKIKFNLIGVKALPDVAKRFENVIPESKLNLTHRVNRSEALEVAARSHVLLLAGFDTMKGVYTTKVFEYLGLRKNIIQVPGDGDVVEELLNYTQSGKAPHSAEEFCSVIMDWYREWEQTGKLEFNGIDSRINEYSRRSQFQKLYTFLSKTDAKSGAKV